MKKLSFLIFILGLLFGGVARAEKKEWSIIKLDDSKSIMAIFNGEITWGDTITLLLEKKNGSCDTVKKYIFFYSAKKNQNIVNLKGTFIPVEINLEISKDGKVLKLPNNSKEQKYIGIGDVSPYLLGHQVIFNIGTFSYANLINSFAMITKYTLKIVDDLEPNKHQDIKIKNFKASDYFDVSYNYWNLTNTKEALIKARNLCMQY